MGASSTKSLEGKTALITGASRGLGQQLVLQMSRLGLSKVIILGVSEEATLNFIQSMSTSEHCLHTTAVFYKCDVSNLTHIQTVMQRVFTDSPVIDILINNAGYVIGKDALDTLFGEFEKILHVNLLSHIYLTKLLLPRMLESQRGGQIVFVSSVLGLFTIPGASAYVTSKHALNGFVSSLQQELKQRKVSNVSVQLVCPGHFDSQMFQEAKVKYPRLTPPMKTEEVAKVIVEECILDRERRFLITPWLMTNSVILAKLILPISMYEFICDHLGVNEFMAGGIQPSNQENKSGSHQVTSMKNIQSNNLMAGKDEPESEAINSEVDLSSNQDTSDHISDRNLIEDGNEGYFCHSSGDESVKYFRE